jgi:hypothetical protein
LGRKKGYGRSDQAVSLKYGMNAKIIIMLIHIRITITVHIPEFISILTTSNTAGSMMVRSARIHLLDIFMFKVMPLAWE